MEFHKSLIFCIQQHIIYCFSAPPANAAYNRSQVPGTVSTWRSHTHSDSSECISTDRDRTSNLVISRWPTPPPTEAWSSGWRCFGPSSPAPSVWWCLSLDSMQHTTDTLTCCQEDKHLHLNPFSHSPVKGQGSMNLQNKLCVPVIMLQVFKSNQ